METPPNLCNNYKGKSVIIFNSTVDMTCGICLSDVGQSIRGQINSCDHYFCFICIMEWSKVETRCPICKQRFTSIRRPTGTNFAHERIVDLPERNQVYSYLGNQSTSISDPYAEIKCSICLNRSNEEFLLLCDLCDSASHTYCVGLGATVPDSDWYCPDCALIRSQHFMFESDPAGCHQDSYDRLKAVRSSRGRTDGFETELRVRGENYARTLCICRNLQDRIQQIRENWNSIQSGKLNFPLHFIEENKSNVMKNCEKSMSSEELPQEEITRIAKQNARRHNDVKKAWKVFGKAKSREGTQKLPFFTEVSNVSTNISNPCKASSKHSMSPIHEQIGFHARAEKRIKCVHNVQECEKYRKEPYLMDYVAKSIQSSSKILDFDPSTSIAKSQKKRHVSTDCADKNHNTRNETKSRGTKVEVRSLVKLNLKLESRGMKLSSDKFREVARASTHSILATCGVEHSKSCARTISMPKCKHFGQYGEQSKYNLMSSSCRECFYSFVKHVVSTILVEMHGK